MKPVTMKTLLLVQVLFVASLLVINGCKTVDSGQDNRITAARQMQNRLIEGDGWLSVFLNLKDFEDYDAAITIDSLEINTENGWISLESVPITINTGAQSHGQFLLARHMVPTGTLYGLRLHLQQAVIRENGKNTVLAIKDPGQEMPFPSGLVFKPGDSHSVFVAWNVRESIQYEPEAMLIPAMHVSMQAIPLISELLFLACPDIETIYVLRTDMNWVISSLGITGKPHYLVAGHDSDKLFVLASRENLIKVVDLQTFRIVDEFRLLFDFEPSYMFLDDSRSYAYVLDKRGRSVALVNLSTGVQETRVNVPFSPQFGISVSERNLIAVSGGQTNKVYLLNPQTFNITGTISVGSNPDGLLAWDGLIYVAESDTNTVAVYDLSTKGVKNRINVGFSPRRLLLKDQQIYITNSASGSVSVIFPGQLNVSRDIKVGDTPVEIEATQSRRWLYVSDAKMGGLHVIDSTSNRLNYFINLSTVPGGMSVIE